MSKGLEALKKAWKQGKRDAKEFSNPTFNDGHYLTKIVKAEIGQSKKGTDQIVVDFQFIEGEYTGKSKRNWLTLDTDNRQGFAMTLINLERLGLGDTEPETLESDLRTLLGRIVRIALVTTTSKKDGQEYQNIRIEKVVGVDPDAQDAAPVEDVAPEPDAETEEPEVEEAAEEEEEPKPAKKSKKSKGSEEPEEEAEVEEEEEDEDGVEIVKGMKVSFTKKDGSELTGKIDDIDEDNGKVVIVAKDADGKTKKFRVDVDRVSAL